MPLSSWKLVCWLVGCLTSQQQASVSQGRICSDNFTCCHTEIEVADPTFYLTQSQYTDTGPTSPSADPITPGACQVTTGKIPSKRDSNPRSSTLEADALPLGQRGGQLEAFLSLPKFTINGFTFPDHTYSVCSWPGQH